MTSRYRSHQPEASSKNLKWDASKASALAAIDLEILGERIRRARQEQKISQRDLTRDLFTSAYLSSLELGKTRPTYQTLTILSERLGKSLDYFIRPASQAGIVADEEQARVIRARLALFQAEVLLSQAPENEQTGRLLDEIEKLHFSRLSEREKAWYYLLTARHANLNARASEAETALERARSYLMALRKPEETFKEPVESEELEARLLELDLEYEEGRLDLLQGKGLAALTHFQRGLELLGQTTGNIEPSAQATEGQAAPGEALAGERASYTELMSRLRSQDLSESLWQGAGQAYLSLGELEEAARAFGKALSCVEDNAGKVQLFYKTAESYLERGEFVQAGFYLGQSRQTLRESAERQSQVINLSELASLEARLGRYDESRAHASRALEEYRKETGGARSSNPAESCRIIAQLVTLARVEARQDKLDDALNYVEEALSLKASCPEALAQGQLNLVAGEVYKRLGRKEEARGYYELALSAFEDQGGPVTGGAGPKAFLAEAYYNYGQSLREWGEIERAFEYLDKAYQM
ncbi:MAG TPA: helix-turn-helix transcriptional regulator [Chloroflexia bacterium]|nr:helix-turn-helix transcriptional regulator [Chloroflexia bacterium]